MYFVRRNATLAQGIECSHRMSVEVAWPVNQHAEYTMQIRTGCVEADLCFHKRIVYATLVAVWASCVYGQQFRHTIFGAPPVHLRTDRGHDAGSKWR